MPTKGKLLVIPQPTVTIELPEILDSGRAFTIAYNKVLRTTVKTVLERHHRKTSPSHFTAANKRQYDHQTRSKRTNYNKRTLTQGVVDLVKTGKTKARMTAAKSATVRGSGSPGSKSVGRPGVVARITNKFPFPVVRGGSGPSKDKVNPWQMAVEIERSTPGQRRAMVRHFTSLYVKGMKKKLSKRIKKRLIGAGSTSPILK